MKENNIFKYIKEQLDAREVIRDILGEPQAKSGETWKWSSPLRDGDTDPSLCVNDKQITDFGGDFSGDIFNFRSKYENISIQEALQSIIEEYNIDIPKELTNLPMETKKKKVTAKTVTTSYQLEQSEKVPEEIYCMFDTIGFDYKPEGNEIGAIKNRIPTLVPMVYKLKAIEEEVKTGHTCIPAGIKSQQDWQDNQNYSQVFMVDVDNVKTVNGEKKNFTIDDKEHVTIDKIVDYCNKIKLQPTFAYTTFSHSEKQHKFRLVYVLEVATQKQEEIKGVYEFFKSTFKDFNIDTAPTNIATLFLGGKEIIYESNKFYNIKKIEEEKTIEDIEIIDNAELSLAHKSLRNTGYVISPPYLGYLKKDDFVPISNFVVYIPEKRNYKNGQDTETKYVAQCILLENSDIQLPPQILTVEDYKKFDFILGSSWDKYAIIKAGNTLPAKLREVTQLISRNTMVEKNIYAHTGFTRINGKLVFLYHGGYIGEGDNIVTDLSASSNLTRFCFTDKTFDKKESLQRSFSFLDIADKKVTIPIIADIYLAPLYSLLAERKVNVDFVLFIVGKTGSRKSILTALALCHYGDFDKDNFPSTFRDTINTIEKKAFILKDLVNVIDDFNPENNAKIKTEIVEKISAMYGDRTGRGRMSKDGVTLKEAYRARGTCMITAETQPDIAQSRLSRMLSVDIKPNSVDYDKLIELQKHSEKLAFAMKHYIQYIIDNEDKIIDEFVNKFEELRKAQDKTIHGRITDAIIVLLLGFNTFLQFMLENDVITYSQKTELEEKAKIVLNELQTEQISIQEELKPVEMFYNAINQLFATKAIQVKSYTGDDFFGSGGTLVGYYDTTENMYYFYPDIIYQKVIEFYSKQNTKFPLTKRTLWKYMLDEGNIYTTAKADRIELHRTICGVKHKVIAVRVQGEVPFDTTIRETPYTPYLSSRSNNIF